MYSRTKQKKGIGVTRVSVHETGSNVVTVAHCIVWCIFLKLLCNEPQRQGLTLAHEQIPCNVVWKVMPTDLNPWSRVLLEKLIVCSDSQEIPRILWNSKVYYHVHNSPPPVHTHPTHTPKRDFPKIHFNIINPPIYAQVFRVVLPFRLSNQNFVRISPLCALHSPPISSSLIW
jgi:hypothetical protein